MNWKDVGIECPNRKHHNRDVLVKIDNNCGYMVVRWDDYNYKFFPLSYYNQDIAKNLITGISHWCEINA